MANQCGAKTRSGGRCRRYGMPNGRCPSHGGKSTGPKNGVDWQPAKTHGIYCREMTEEEVSAVATIPPVSLHHEITAMRVRLRRTLTVEAKNAGQAELDEIIEHDLIGTEGSRKDITSRVRDYSDVVRKTVSSLRALVLAQKEIDAANLGQGEENEKPISRIVVEVRHARTAHDDVRTPG